MSSNRCQRCGLINFAGATECRRCSAPIAWGAEAAAGQPGLSQQPNFNPAASGYSQQPVLNAGFGAPNSGLPGSQYVSPYAPPTKLRMGQATASLVMGILSIFSAGLIGIGSIIGIVLGVKAIRKANREPFIYGGKGVAIGGIVTNSLGLLSFIPIALFVAILIPNLMKARIIANEASAIRALQEIGAAEATYLSTAGEGRQFGTMKQLIDSGYVSADAAHQYGYKFTIRVSAASTTADSNGLGVSFEAVAVPDEYGTTGKNSFYTSESYVIRHADRKGREATAEDEPVDDFYPSNFPSNRRTTTGVPRDIPPNGR